MNIRALHPVEKPVSSKTLFKGEEGRLLTIRILENEKLSEHITKVPALLICVEGRVVFRDETGTNQTLYRGDYLSIKPMMKHWVSALEDSQLLLAR